MFQLREYQPSDAVEILSQANEPGVELNDYTRRWAEKKALKGPAVTAVCDGRIIGCGGIEILWPGFAEGWCLFVNDIDQYTNSVAKSAKRTLDKLIDEHNLHRVQAPMRADFPAGIRFVQWLGFSQEARLRKYHPDKTDALMFSRVR